MAEPASIKVTTGEDLDGLIESYDRSTGLAINFVGAKVWVALKATEDTADGSSAVFIDSAANGSYFDFGSASTGQVGFHIPASLTVNLVPGEVLVLAVKVLLATGRLKYHVIGSAVVEKGPIQAVA